jgi:hypothetical protein
VGVPVTATLTTYVGGVYPTHNDQLGWGGMRVVATHAARDAIATNSCRLGMLVVCQSDGAGVIWQLTTYPPTGTDGDWTQLPGGVTLPVSIANGGTGETTQALGFDALSPLTALGDMIYYSGAGHNVRLAGNISTTPQFLSQVGAGATSAAPVWRVLTASDLPNPSASTLGGIQSAAAVSHQWIASISTSGVPSLSQPAFTDISGTATLAQFPSVAANTILANVTGSSAAPTATAVGLQINQHQGVITVDAPSAGAVTCNMATSDAHSVTLAASTLITLSNPASTGRQTGLLYLIQGGSGSCVPTFSPTVHWGAAGTPAWSTTTGLRDIVLLDWDGTTWRGGVFGLGF